ncbi:hypothetical protein CDN99_10765 [Roseateles aquatilis]|uniref:Porin domain-containing protein n=1 Tax=Roseateles aquatilis TaxID=431061 RepID=A0A246JDJ2_9BURK|nr:hypothetical protein [Roseateles aquatilis]OWQ90669.1 hypothetical protein CDN99_10765 [Roseateles aquatilis]
MSGRVGCRLARRGLLVLLLGCGARALAAPAPPAEEDALAIADAMLKDRPAEPAAQTRHRVFVEGSAAYGGSNAATRQTSTVASLDYWLRQNLGGGWSGLWSGRLDGTRDSRSRPSTDWTHTLRELAVEWQPDPRWVLDLGRINAQYGEAIAFNPSDVFREGALRSVTSVVPANLRTNRQGVVMARMQYLWQDGSVQAVLAPRIDGRSSATFSPDWGATNPRQRWLLAVSQKLGAEVTPQIMLTGGEGMSPLAAMSVSFLPLAETVAYVEASTGRRRSTLSRIGLWPDDTSMRTQVAVGANWNPLPGATFGLEFDYDGVANDAAQRHALEQMPLRMRQAYGAALIQYQTLQDRRQWFVSASWKDALGPGTDISALARIDGDAPARQYWLEVRHRFDATEVAVRLLWRRNPALGATPDAYRQAGLLLSHYF